MANVARMAMTTAVMLFGINAPAAAQDPGAREAYFRAVAEFFQVPLGEVSLLGEWEIPAGEIPVALFVARRAGVSPGAVVALRRSGRGWQELARRYHLDASSFHIPLPPDADAGILSEAYGAYRSRPSGQWSTLTLSDDAIIALVNLRVISQTLTLPAETVVGRMSPGTSPVELYASLLRRSGR